MLSLVRFQLAPPHFQRRLVWAIQQFIGRVRVFLFYLNKPLKQKVDELFRLACSGQTASLTGPRDGSEHCNIKRVVKVSL